MTDLGGRLRVARVSDFEGRDEMASLSREFMSHTLDVPCPGCGYLVWVVMAEIVSGSMLICPCCRVGIRLVDETGSVQVAATAMQEAVDSLGDVFKRRS
jgi:hypothetical protein